jgi:tRNA-dihydrouridine synthase 3
LRSFDRPVNTLDKDVQQALWKGRYDFSRANAVLASLGVDPGPGKSRKGQREHARLQQKQAPQAGGQSHGKSSTQQQQQVSGASTERSTKRVKLVLADVGQSGPEAVADDLEDLYAEPSHGNTPAADVLLAAAGEELGPADGVQHRDDKPVVDDAAEPGRCAAAQLSCSEGAAGAAAPALPSEGDAAEAPAAGTAASTAPAAGVAASAAVAAASADLGAAAALANRAAYVEGRLPAREKPLLDLRGKTYLAPLTTVRLAAGARWLASLCAVGH